MSDFAGFKSNYGSGGRYTHDRLKDMPVRSHLLDAKGHPWQLVAKDVTQGTVTLSTEITLTVSDTLRGKLAEHSKRNRNRPRTSTSTSTSPTTIDLLDLVGAAETAGIWGVELQRISRWRKTGRLPVPYLDLAMSPVWLRADMEGLRDGTLGLNECEPPSDPPVVFGVAELVAFLGVNKSRVSRWRHNPNVDFPEPDVVIAAGPLWKRSTIEAFEVDYYGD